ncbi:MAG: hypothetical protein AB1414_02220 [bacterium]
MSFLEQLFQILDSVLPNRVSYGTNIVDANELQVYPFIIYQEISDRVQSYADNKSAVRIITYQITLVTESKEPTIEEQLESALYQSGFNYQMITEYVNDDNSVTRVYEIKQEEIKYE